MQIREGAIYPDPDRCHQRVVMSMQTWRCDALSIRDRFDVMRSSAPGCQVLGGMRYYVGMTNPFVQSMASNFNEALRLMEAALTDCPGDLWETDLWPDEAPTGPEPHGGLHGSAPWFLAYHALVTLDYDLSAEFESWEPPQPFDENTYAFPNRMFTNAELLGYIDYCRERVRRTLDALTEDVAARPLPSAHRYHGMLYGVIVGRMPLHVLEHASQIRQFLTAAGVTVRPMPGDRGYVP